jgi:hypothetical protein
MANMPKPIVGHCLTSGCDQPVPQDHPYPWCAKCGAKLPDAVRERIRQDVPAGRSFLSRAYAATVGNPKVHLVLLGLVGLGGLYVGASRHLEQGRPWPSGVTLGILALIWAVQGLTGAHPAAIRNTSRILVTFYLVSLAFQILQGDFSDGLATLAASFLMVFLIFLVTIRIWRKEGVERP